jgi:hypothetical protein
LTGQQSKKMATGRRHNNARTLSGLGSPENPILIGLDCEDADTQSEFGSAQHPILIEDRDILPRSDDTELESDSGPSSEGEPALFRGLKVSAQQQNGGQFRGGSPAAYPSSVQVAGGQDEPAEPAVATDQGNVDPLWRKVAAGARKGLAAWNGWLLEWLATYSPQSLNVVTSEDLDKKDTKTDGFTELGHLVELRFGGWWNGVVRAH